MALGEIALGGAFALAGSLFTALATYLTQRGTLEIQRQKNEADHIEAKAAREDDRLRALARKRIGEHQMMLTLVYEFREAAREFHNQMDEGDFSKTRSYADYHDAWDKYSACRGVAMLSGPLAVTKKLRELLDQIAHYSTLLDVCHADQTKPGPDVHNAQEAVKEACDAYIMAAQDALGLK